RVGVLLTGAADVLGPLAAVPVAQLEAARRVGVPAGRSGGSRTLLLGRLAARVGRRLARRGVGGGLGAGGGPSAGLGGWFRGSLRAEGCRLVGQTCASRVVAGRVGDRIGPPPSVGGGVVSTGSGSGTLGVWIAGVSGMSATPAPDDHGVPDPAVPLAARSASPTGPSSVLSGDDADTAVGSSVESALAVSALASRLRYAVTALPADTIDTTSQPAADRSVSFGARL